MSFAFLDGPALHPRLLEPDTRAALAARWREAGGHLRIDDVLEPGLAAELVRVFSLLPYTARYDEELEALVCRCEIVVPPHIEPQIAECVFRLVRALDTDLPQLVGELMGRPVRPLHHHRIEARTLRKGSFIDAGHCVALRPVELTLGLTNARWPRDHGGWLELLDDAGATSEVLAPGWDTLDIVVGRRFRVPVVERHVDAFSVTSALKLEEPR